MYIPNFRILEKELLSFYLQIVWILVKILKPDTENLSMKKIMERNLYHFIRYWNSPPGLSHQSIIYSVTVSPIWPITGLLSYQPVSTTNTDHWLKEICSRTENILGNFLNTSWLLRYVWNCIKYKKFKTRCKAILLQHSQSYKFSCSHDTT